MATADSPALPTQTTPPGGKEGPGGVWGRRLPAPGRGRDQGADGDGTGPGGSGDAVPEGPGELGSALGGADAVRGRPEDPHGQQYLRATCTGPGGGAEELLRLGVALEWPISGVGVLDLRHVGAVGAQCPEVADLVLRALRGGRGQGPWGHRIVPAMEPEPGEEAGTGGTRAHGRGRHFVAR